MIGYLQGSLTYKDDKSAIISVGGIGYIVYLPAHTLAQITLETKITLWTHLSVREDALDLFGFTDREELSYFKLLIGISGIGPKSALAILSLAPPSTLRQAVLSGNTDYLTKVSGIGRKSAEKIIIELRDKLGALETSELMHASGDNDLLDALSALGYQPRDIRDIIHKISAEADTTDKRIKEALRLLGNQH
ncbi:MAG: Holliday junction DNA helicase RuvA [Candidatus Vogelbacteria bacterium RIFOXYD1_FULL_44_32]|uniref:Holliday junction branch migration complex subunit RuvA n=1 Tax=Candidatus Vogelbacteria bacterium RIFOXYD1_FULL_44_32 TaxID=1802438 RepID=A0A1G2QEA5_9BACT|nr:MAG: Holliday junction DNA helicase RuvA [Candidatus Vogelbacteria bacterium RIFOXYD1_FULL_44_32]